MKNLFFIIVENKSGKRYAYPVKHGINSNLLNLARDGVEIIHPAETWKKAKETADAWNKSYKENGSYLWR